MQYQLDLELIHEKRIEKGFTTQQMADFLGVKGKSSYSKRESGETGFKSVEIPVLSDILGIPIGKIFVKTLRKSKHHLEKEASR